MEYASVGSIKKVSLKVRTLRSRALPYGETLSAPEHVARAAHAMLKFEDQEVVLVFFVDGLKRVTAVHEATRGTIDSCVVHAREIYRAAIVFGAAAIVLVHNHPSGSQAPSIADARATEAMQHAGEVLGIQLLDHVIVTPGGDHYSFVDDGRLGDYPLPLAET
jgi:DNA repair protein RadC